MAAEGAGPDLTAAKMAAAFGFDLELASSVVLVFDSALVPVRSTTRAHRKAKHPFRQVGTLAEGVDIVVAAGPGAPVAAITVEFLHHFGVQQFVSVGSAGRLTEPAGGTTPTHYVVSNAVSDEGTSAHFGTNLTADATLTHRLADRAGAVECTTLTTDVPFRHTPERLLSHRSRAQVTEMECAALYAAAHHFVMRAGSLVVASDVFAETGWRPIRRRGTDTALHEAVRIAAQVLAEAP